MAESIQQKKLNKELLVAAAEDNIERVKEAINHGASVNCRKDNLLFGYYSNMHLGWTPLHGTAVNAKILDIIQVLKSSGLDVNAKDFKSKTPLHCAAANAKSVDVLQVLLSAGADVNAKDKENQTPLHLAANKAESVDVLKVLLTAGADVNARTFRNQTPLHLAANKAESVDVLKVLLTAGADVNARTFRGQTPLHHAAVYAKTVDIVQVLLSSGANVNAKDEDKWTPLHLAAQNTESVDVIKVLLSSGAYVDAKDEDVRRRKQIKGCGIPEEYIDIIPTDEILDALAPTVGDQSLELGIVLEIPIYDLKIIHRDFSSTVAQTREILRRWRDQRQVKATFGRLQEALVDVGIGTMYLNEKIEEIGVKEHKFQDHPESRMHTDISALNKDDEISTDAGESSELKKSEKGIPEEYIDIIPTDEILDALAPTVGDQSLELGIVLETPIYDLKIIHRDFSSTVAQTREILRRWRDERQVKATFGRLQEALVDVGIGTMYLNEKIEEIGVKEHKFHDHPESRMHTDISALNKDDEISTDTGESSELKKSEKDLKYPELVVCDGLVIDCITDQRLEIFTNFTKDVTSKKDFIQMDNYALLLICQRRVNMQKQHHYSLESWIKILYFSIEKEHDLLCRYILANSRILNIDISVWNSVLKDFFCTIQKSTYLKPTAWHITRMFAKSLCSLRGVFDIWPGCVCNCNAGTKLHGEKCCSNKMVIVVEHVNNTPNIFPSHFHGFEILYKTVNGYSEEGKSVVLETNRIYSDIEPETLSKGIQSSVAETLFKYHSKLSVISPSLLKSRGFKTKQKLDRKPCIQLYCRVKGVIPFGEEHFPKTISSIQTDVLEGHSDLLVKNIRIGSEIGPICGGSGTLGGFVKYLGEEAFLTCAHVVLSKECLFKSSERQQIHEQRVLIQYINQGETGTLPTVCGKLYSYLFPPESSKEGTSIDAAIVMLDTSKVKIDRDDVLFDNGFHLSINDIGLQSVYLNKNFIDHKDIGTSMQLISRSAGIVSGLQEKTDNVCNNDELVLRFEKFSQVLDRMLNENAKPLHITEDVHVKEQVRKIDDIMNEFPPTVTLYNQISFQNISFQQGDSGTCIYVANQTNTVSGCIGMAIASHPNGGCIVTPLKAILSAFKMI